MRFAENIRIFSSQDGNNKYAVRIISFIEPAMGLGGLLQDHI